MRGKNSWALFLLLLAGIVLGGYFGYLAKDVSFLSWLNYGQEFGIGSSNGSGAAQISFGIISITFGMKIKITIGSIIGIILAIFAYRKM